MKTVVWDIDDVLVPSTEIWLDKWYPNPKKISFDQLTANPPHEILGIEKEEYLNSIDEFRKSSSFAELAPHKEVINWFEEKGHLFNHIALTARPINNAGFASKWMFIHFGKWIRQFIFVPSSRPGDPNFQYFKNKNEALESLKKVDFFIDDTPKNVSDALNAGFNAIEYPQPWNKQTLSVSKVLDLIK